MGDLKVSVIITTFNGATRGFLRNAIDSVLAQTEQAFELILVDDGSTDATGDLCREYLGDVRIRYIRQKNQGVAAARNTGISMATQKLICFLDDDDAWKPEKLARQIQEFDRNPQTGLVYTAIEIVNERGSPVGLQRHPVPDNAYLGLFYENFVDATSSVMVRRDVVEKVGGFRADQFGPDMQACEDRELWSRIAREHLIVAIPEALVVYRMGGQKLSRNLRQMELGELKMLSLALADAPPDVRRQAGAIHANAMRRVAMEYFAVGEYRDFREKVLVLMRSGQAGIPLVARFILSLLPGAVWLVRGLTLQFGTSAKGLRKAD